ncbi:MAG: penicillin-binding protein 2, partial [Clostridiales bacterium]|nr:penicillin-binding protein 2 [Clostridiales bacterium]
YTDASGHGVSGLEKLYDNWLSEAEGSLKLTYAVSALGRPLAGEDPEITDTRLSSIQGVQLTIDSRIQKIAEQAAEKYLTQGAVVVMEVPNGKIRASVSVPDFSPVNLEDALTDPLEPMVNRAFSSYNVGSIFKPVTAAAALELGVSPSQSYECTGSVDVSGVVFHCNNLNGHGVLNMEEALAHSCNCYFIHLAQDIGASALWNMADRMGFGHPLSLCEGLSVDEGVLPTLSALQSPAALANLAFGQGELMASPVQMAAVFCAIAADGQMPRPSVVEGLIDENGRLPDDALPYQSATVMSPQNAAMLRSLLDAPLEYGTAVPAAPENVAAGGKTATAETGIIRDGKSIVQTWFAGFFPYNEPKYVVVVFAEASPSGSRTSSPVFKEIAEKITELQKTGIVS